MPGGGVVPWRRRQWLMASDWRHQRQTRRSGGADAALDVVGVSVVAVETSFHLAECRDNSSLNL